MTSRPLHSSPHDDQPFGGQGVATSRRLVWLLLACLSGCAALCYEILWLRRLGDLLGNSVFATQIVLAVFFGGMALGAAVATRWLGDALRRYVQIEALMALYGLSSPWLLDLIGGLYNAQAANASLGWLSGWRVAVSVLFLLLPTLCMGATLPLLVHLARDASERLDLTAGRLYLWNTLGAVGGTILAGIFLPRWLGVKGGLWYAASLNGFVAWAAWRHRGLLAPGHGSGDTEAEGPYRGAGPEAIPALWWLLFLASGFCAMAYEVLWARGLLSLLGNSIYSFAAILSVYLLGLALGGGAWRYARRWGASFGLLQALLGCLGVSSIWLLDSLPVLKAALLAQIIPDAVNPLLSGLFVEWSMVALLFFGPALCIGMLFPAMLDVFAKTDPANDHEAKEPTGYVLAVSTLGGVLAPLLVGLWLLPLFGLRGMLWAVGAGNLVVALLALGLRRSEGRSRAGTVLLIAGALLLIAAPRQQALVSLALGPGEKLLRYKEGRAASLAVVEDRAGRRKLKLNGRFSMGGQAGLFGERRQGHLPRLLTPRARKLLVLGVGTGHTLAAMASHPYAAIDAVEIVPGVFSLLPLFAKTNRDIAWRPGVRLIADDARHVLATSSQTYDLIASELFHPYKAGVGGLYSREHFRRGRRSLRKRGVFWQWLPLHQLTPKALQVIVGTYLDVFPHVRGFLAYLNARTPAFGLAGSISPIGCKLSLPAKGSTLRTRLAAVGLGSDVAIWSMHMADRAQLEAFSRGAPRNTEDRPWIELHMPEARWSADWSKLGARHLATMLQWPASTSWKDCVPAKRRKAYLHRSRSTRSYLRSRLHTRAGRHRKATDAMLLAARLDRSWSLPRKLLSNRASALIQKRRYLAARSLLRRIVDALPDHGEAWALLGNVYYLQARAQSKPAPRRGPKATASVSAQQRAIAAYRQALRVSPGLWLASRNLILLLDRSGQSRAAAQHIKLLLGRQSHRELPRLAQKIAARLATQAQWAALRELGQAMCRQTSTVTSGCQFWAFGALKQGAWRVCLKAVARALAHLPQAQRASTERRLLGWKLQAQIQRKDIDGAAQTLATATRRYPGHDWSFLAQQLQALKAMKQLAAPPMSTGPSSRPAGR